MFVVDTNIFVYAANEACPEHVRCLEFVQECQQSRVPWFTTWGIFYEFLRVSTHPRVLVRPWSLNEAWTFVESILASPGLQVLVAGPHHADVARQTFKEIPALRGNQIHDAHTAILMREHGIKQISTRDADFHRFPFLEILDPMTPG